MGCKLGQFRVEMEGRLDQHSSGIVKATVASTKSPRRRGSSDSRPGDSTQFDGLVEAVED